MSMRDPLKAVLAVASLACPLFAAAQPAPPIKPGLWQMKMQSDAADAGKMREMEEQMKAMSPEERKMVEGMMKQHGVSMAGPGDLKVCITKETLAEGGWRDQQRESGCKTDTTRDGNVWKFRSSCPAPHASETDGEATFVSDTKYTMKSTTTHTDGGQKKTTTMSGTSTWLGADCGDIKPAQGPKKK